MSWSREQVVERHRLVGSFRCPECEAPFKVKDKHRPKLIKCDCGATFFSYASP